MATPQGKGLLRSMSPALSLLASGKDGLSAKEKKYVSGVEKLVSTSDTAIVEWADHIAFLSRLLKALQANPDTEHTRQYVPHALEVSKCLSTSLSKNLPSGVHKKALEVYEHVFRILGPRMAESVAVWLPGLLPLMSYASTGVKPQLVAIFRDHIVQLPTPTLKTVLRPVLLSLLPSVDDETSETFAECLDLLDRLKQNVADDAHFWSVVFLVVITSGDKRLGALVWCQRRLPSFNTDSRAELSPEAVSCVDPSAQLLLKAVSRGLVDDNLLVQRGFFDLLVSHLELKSCVLQELAEPRDLQELVVNASYAVLRRDMSLNRRLWNWLLGPDEPQAAPGPPHSEADGDAGTDNGTGAPTDTTTVLSRSEYFARYGLQLLQHGLLELINGECRSRPPVEQRVDGFRIALAVMDKWEIGQAVIPHILTPIWVNTRALAAHDDVLKTANVFFDNVDCLSLWSNFTRLVLRGDLDLCLFVLQNFNVEEEEMVVGHLPLVLLALLCVPAADRAADRVAWTDLVTAVGALIPQRAYLPVDHADTALVAALTPQAILAKIETYYFGDDEPAPFSTADLSLIVLDRLSQLTLAGIESVYRDHPATAPQLYHLCVLHADVLDKVPHLENRFYRHDALARAVYLIGDHPLCLDLAFGVGKLFHHVVRAETDTVQRMVFLQSLVDQLWAAISSRAAAKFQVEIVRLVFELEMSVPAEYVESALAKALNREPHTAAKLAKFGLLWTHSSGFQDSGLFLAKSVELVMDELHGRAGAPLVRNWLVLQVAGGGIARFFKVLVSPLLRYGFLTDGAVGAAGSAGSAGAAAHAHDDFAACEYRLDNVVRLVRADRRIADAMRSEVLVVDDDQVAAAVRANGWHDLTYKTVLVQFCAAALRSGIRDADCFARCLETVSVLVDGSEPYFGDYFKRLLQLAAAFDDGPLKTQLIALVLVLLQRAKGSGRDVFADADLGDDDNLVLQLVLDNVLRATDSNAIVPLVKLLSESLTLFGDSIFTVILRICNTVLLKIDELFGGLRGYLDGEDEAEAESEAEAEGEAGAGGAHDVDVDSARDIARDSSRDHTSAPAPQDTDQSVSLLLGALEEVLSVSHSYLLAHQVAPGDAAAAHGADQGFFGSVIQGVFQSDHHQDTSAGLVTKKTAVALSFKNSVCSVYRIWLWAEANSKISLVAASDNNKSLTYIATRFKYRSKKFLELLYTIEPAQVVESLVSCDAAARDTAARDTAAAAPGTAIFKILHVLDGSRPNLTLPHLLASITRRCPPSQADPDDVNAELDAPQLARFVFRYFESLDADLYEDLYPVLSGFLKTITANVPVFRPVYPAVMKTVVVVASALGPESRRSRRELDEVFFKMLSILANSKSAEEDERNGFLDAASFAVPSLRAMHFEPDRLNAIHNTIISFLQPYMLRNDFGNNLVEQCVLAINAESSSKGWKSLVNDVTIGNAAFFQSRCDAVALHHHLVARNFAGDYDRIGDLLAKLTANNSNFLNWNDYSEIVQGKKLNIKRIVYLVACCPADAFINAAAELIARTRELLAEKDLKPEVYLLMRCLVLKFSDSHLSGIWVVVYTELYKLFSVLAEDPAKADLPTVLSGCKLLDVLAYLKSEEFQLNEWLFMADSEMLRGGVPALVDRIAALQEQDQDAEAAGGDPDVQDAQKQQQQQQEAPLLLEVKSVRSFKQLQRIFFARLSAANLQQVLNTQEAPVSHDLLEQDLFNDLFL